MTDISPESPEARRHDGGLHRQLGDLGISGRVLEVLKRVAIGTYTDGFTHAGNLAYLSLVTLFPFFIVAAAIAQLFGRTGDGLHAVTAFLRTVPPGVDNPEIMYPVRSGDFVTEARLGWKEAYDSQMRASVRPLQQAAE